MSSSIPVRSAVFTSDVNWQSTSEDESEDSKIDSDDGKHEQEASEGLPAPVASIVIQHDSMLGAPSLTVTVATLKHMFSRSNIWERAHAFTCGILEIPETSSRTINSHRLYKAMRKSCFMLLRNEYKLIKQNIRLLQRRRHIQKGNVRRIRKPRPLSNYAAFCRELRANCPHEIIVGKMQQLWIEEKKRRQTQSSSSSDEGRMISLKRLASYDTNSNHGPVSIMAMKRLAGKKPIVEMSGSETETDSDDMEDEEEEKKAVTT